MPRRNKLQKFHQILSYPNVYQNYRAEEPILVGKDRQEVELKGQWCEKHFGNDHPLVLELACGRGEYSLALGRAYPEKNFLGLDIKGARIWKGASIALEEGLDNVAFLRCRIEMIANFLGQGEVDEIWITFPDPFLRDSKANRRLTSANFLKRYKQILKPGGLIHLKTDEIQLYDFTLETLAEQDDFELLIQNDDIYKGALPMPELAFKTYYERMHLANQKTIKYIRFRNRKEVVEA